MAISFNNIPGNVRTPGAYVEIDNSRALKSQSSNPHKVLIVGQKLASGSTPVEVIKQITSASLGEGFFGPGSILARMCNTFRENNPTTEVYAVALSNAGGTAANGMVKFASGLSVTADATYFLLINGVKAYTTLTKGWSVTDVCSAVKAIVNSNDRLPVTCSVSASAAGSNHLVFLAKQSGTLGNYIDIRANYYAGQSNPAGWGEEDISYVAMSAGATDPDLGDLWAIVENERYHYIVNPYIDAANLTELEDEMATRFGPMQDLQGHGFTAVRATLASCTTLGNSRNSPHNTIMGAYNSPSGPEEWAAAMAAQASYSLNIDPARPLHTLKLKGILPPPKVDLFSREERDILLYDGISTFIVDAGGGVLLERLITTYQTNALGITDASYLDVETLATLGEIRDRYKNHMVTRFIVPRVKLADDGFPVTPGSNIVTPRTIKQEIIALFTDLQSIGLIENLSDFVENLIVERDASDANKVNVLLPPDLVNQFRVLATSIQYLL